MNKARGFTLLEILIALFIFTILSMILVTSLHNMINLQSSAEANADRLRKLQMALLVLSRDIEQAVNRPVRNASGNEESAFLGSANGFTFTHAGFANPTGTVIQSGLQRARYIFNDHSLQRLTWEALDQAPQALSRSRQLLTDLTEMHFKYLDNSGVFHNDWPIEGQTDQPLPRAIRVYLKIANWGSINQIYVISAQKNKISQQPASS